MKLGLNLSFAVKRWMKPDRLARMCREEFGIRHVQFTWDLIDPWWPDEPRDKMIAEYKEAFHEAGVKIDATFAGLAAYTYGNLLAPSKIQREIAVTYFKRAIDLTVKMGANIMGTPVGGMDYEDARREDSRRMLYNTMLESLHCLARYGREKGLKEIQIEATPLWTEFPHTPETSLQLMRDMEGSAVPVRLLIDWGHALFKPLLKEKADMELWLQSCAPYVTSIHLQQTDGLWDRHWNFTKEGIITPDLVKRTILNAGLQEVTQYLEVVTAFEEDDEAVYEGMKKTMDYLHRNL